ncbi:response regulator [Lacibacterium aquatile]|uniref:histidine kinase n=1 Tax=Lacibacterium aquatile TaxID=1168082 RepID=A0ABW5DMJ9_9PROT
MAGFFGKLLGRRTATNSVDLLAADLDVLPLASIVVTRDGEILSSNAAYGALVSGLAGGLERVDAIGREDDRPMLLSALSVEDASTVEISTAGAPSRVFRFLIGPENAGRRMVCVDDITTFRILEGQVVQSQKMQAIGQLAGGVAHDFNNLLTAMIGYCDLLLQRHRPGDASFADMMQIKQNANRAASLVRQLLAFSRKQQLKPVVLDITDALIELSHLLRRLIGQQVTLDLEHGRDLGMVRVDLGQFEQVVVNLAINARDAMPRGGHLTIRTSNDAVTHPRIIAHETMPAGEYVKIEVRDTGTGIPTDVIGRIFEPFFTTKPIGAGTGLGLSTVYGIVRQTGGFIAVHSQMGRGASFTIWLPRHRGDIQDEGPREVEAASPTEAAQDASILLVEDEDPVRAFAARALRGKGYRVMEARHAEAALQLLEGGEVPDLMITDVVMPGMDGPTLIHQVRQNLPSLPVICVSGHADDDLRTRLDQLGGAIAFLPKPFSLKQLSSRVHEMLKNG